MGELEVPIVFAKRPPMRRPALSVRRLTKAMAGTHTRAES
jgi:hypothetical protein